LEQGPNAAAMIQYLIFLRAQLILKIVLGEGQIHRGQGCNRNGAVIIQKGCYSIEVQVDLTSFDLTSFDITW
jgi:hypothetical protein